MQSCDRPAPKSNWLAESESAGVQASEEIKFDPKVMCEKLDRRQTLHQAQLENGDILIAQQAIAEVNFTCLLPSLFLLHFTFMFSRCDTAIWRL